MSADDRAPPRDEPAPRPERGPVLALVLASAALAATIPALPLWLDRLGVHDPALLATYSAAAFGGGVVASMLATPLWGVLGDRTSHRSMVLRACLGLAVAQALMGLATAPWQVVAIRVLQGLTSGVEPALYAMVVARAGPRGSGSAIGRLESASTVGGLLGPVAMAGLLLMADFPALFFGASTAAMLAGAVVLLTTAPSPRAAPLRRGSPWQDLRRAATSPGVPGLLAAFGVVVALDAMVELLYPLLVVAHTTAGSERVLLLGTIEIAGEVAYLLAAPALGRVVDRRGPSAVSIPCAALSGLAVLVAPWIAWPWLWVGLVAVGDGASSGIRAALYAEVPRRAPADQHGAVMSLVGAANRAGAALASVVVPLLVGALGLAVAMTTAGGATIGLAARWARRTRAAPPPEPPAQARPEAPAPGDAR